MLIIKRLKDHLNAYAINKEKIYIIPSSIGFRYIFIMFTIFLIGLSYSNNMVLILAFILFTYFILDMLNTHASMNQLEYKSFSIQDQFSDLPVKIQVQTHQDILFKNYQLSLLDKNPELKVKENTLKAVIYLNRGYYPIKNIKISNTGFNKLFYCWRYIKLNKELYIYPKASASHLKQLNHLSQSLNSLEEQDFVYHIPYRQGMNSKRVDWKILARTNQLYWKKFTGTTTNSWEINFNDFSGDNEQILQSMTYLIQYCYKNQIKWDLILPTQKQMNQHNRDDFENCLRILARIKL